MEDPFIAEARNHMAKADRSGRLALLMFLATAACFAINAWHFNDAGAWWVFWWASVGFFIRMLYALESRWFHRTAARVSLETYKYLQRFG